MMPMAKFMPAGKPPWILPWIEFHNSCLSQTDTGIMLQHNRYVKQDVAPTIEKRIPGRRQTCFLQ
jgi:hypothetical protein